jgi:ribosomal protein S18 acetylase RimI-like enzyme
MKLPSLAAAHLERRPGEPAAALLRAAEAWPEQHRGSQLAAILQTAGRQPPRFVVAATQHDERAAALPLAAILAESLPGRSAVVMSPQIDRSLDEPARNNLARELLLTLDSILRQQGVILAQALTAGHDDPASAWFLAAGYRNAGDLLYLSADLTAAEPPLRLPLIGSLQLIPHPPADFARWIPLVERTYVNSLDCPAVDGLRPTRDVLIGYQDIGRPRDDWWLIVQHEGEDIGCLLLADHHPANHAELVYMGVILEMRGRGWGVHLAHQARQIAAASGAEHLILSVDAANTPALRHYQTAGFRFWEQRTIWIKSL